MRSVLHSIRRAFRWHRRWFAALLVAVAVLAALNTVSARDVGGRDAVVAARDIPAGATLGPADLTVARVPAHLLAADSFPETRALIGRTVVAGVSERSLLTSSNLLGSGALVAAGRLAMPVRFAETGALALLHAGGRIDVLGSGANGAGYTVVAADVRVVALPAAGDPGLLGGSQGGLALLEVSADQAAAIAESAAASALAFAMR